MYYNDISYFKQGAAFLLSWTKSGPHWHCPKLPKWPNLKSYIGPFITIDNLDIPCKTSDKNFQNWVRYEILKNWGST